MAICSLVRVIISAKAKITFHFIGFLSVRTREEGEEEGEKFSRSIPSFASCVLPLPFLPPARFARVTLKSYDWMLIYGRQTPAERACVWTTAPFHFAFHHTTLILGQQFSPAFLYHFRVREEPNRKWKEAARIKIKIKLAAKVRLTGLSHVTTHAHSKASWTLFVLPQIDCAFVLAQSDRPLSRHSN